MRNVPHTPLPRSAWFRTLAALLYATCSFESHGSTIQTADITLNGTAAGGVVSVTEVLPIYAGFVQVATTQGESAEEVLTRLADEICRVDPFNWHNTVASRHHWVTVNGNTLTLPSPGLRYTVSGTDKGFDIPKPVLSVSGSYDADKKQVKLSWINPEEAFDAILAGGHTLPPDATNCVYSYDPSRTKWASFGVVMGRRNDTLSPLASIVINTNSQEELDTSPFYMGLAPNWSKWSDSTNAEAVKCEQGLKPDVDMQVRGDSWDKPLYQVIRTTEKGAHGGVWRRFLGLTTGHTYKVQARLNTLEMDAVTNAWAFSFHVAYDNRDGRPLTMSQMAGRAPLPAGTQGLEAGCVARYGPGVTTKGEWVKRSTDEADSGLETKNITLPVGVTSITVWLRYCGANSTGVGMDWIRVEDVTPRL